MDKKYNFCTDCGSKVEEEDRYCKVCGTERRELIDLPETSDYICSGCGESLQLNDKYCCYCGFRSGIPTTITKVEEKKQNPVQTFRQTHPSFYNLLKIVRRLLIFRI